MFFIFTFFGAQAENIPDCQRKNTSLVWTNEVACSFVDITLNYVKTAAGINNRVRGHIAGISAEEDSETVNTEDKVRSAEKVDSNSPVGKLMVLSGSAIRGFSGLKPFFQKRLMQVASEYITIYHKKIVITSAYRSPAHQKILFDNKRRKLRRSHRSWSEAKIYKAARKWVAPPGKSRHNSGMAVDIGYKTPTGNNIARAGLMSKYGIYRPMDYESWHFEPVETRATRHGGKSPLVMDGNISVKNGDASVLMNYGSASLSKKYQVLEEKSRYSQELSLMITELLISRNRTIERSKIQEEIKKMLDIEESYDEIGK